MSTEHTDNTMTLHPSAGIPFEHDKLEAPDTYKQKLKDIENYHTTNQSNEPWKDWLEEYRPDVVVPVLETAEASSADSERQFDADMWLRQHILLGDDDCYWDGTPVPEHHTRDVLNQFLHVARMIDKTADDEATTPAQVAQMMQTLQHMSAGSMSSNELRDYMIYAGYQDVLVKYARDFDGMQFDKSYVQAMMDRLAHKTLLEHWDLVDQTLNPQDVVHDLAKDSPSQAIDLAGIVPGVQIAASIVVAAIDSEGGSSRLFASDGTCKINLGDYSGDETHAILSRVASWGGAKALNLFGSQLSISMVARLVDGLYVTLDGLFLNAPQVCSSSGWVNDLLRYVSDGRASDGQINKIMAVNYAEYGRAAQSGVFAYIHSTGNMTTDMLLRFTGLDDDDYRCILENYHDLLLKYVKDEIGIGQVQNLQDVDALFSKAGSVVHTQYLDDLRPQLIAMLDEANKRILSHEDDSMTREQQRQAELSYFDSGNFSLRLVDIRHTPTPEEIYEQFEHDRCVKPGPRIDEQAADQSRSNTITYVKSRESLGTHTSSDVYNNNLQRITLSEQEALISYVDWLNAAKVRDPSYKEELEGLERNLTFIGQKEYREAVSSIAAYWKHILNSGARKQIYVLKGAITTNGKVKSDEYMLDQILQNFSNRELKRYRGRLIVRDEDIVSDKPEDLSVVLLDDWTISGGQMQLAARAFLKRHPDSRGCLEIQLIAASKERIALGLEGIEVRHDDYTERSISVPVKAYYMAHHDETAVGVSTRGVRITGAHSSVDYGFEVALAHHDAVLPPLANIVRPYRKPQYKQKNTQRLMRLYKM